MSEEATPEEKTEPPVVPETSKPVAVAANDESNSIDVDRSWTGEGSLDEHRTKALQDVKEPGFGREKAKTDG